MNYGLRGGHRDPSIDLVKGIAILLVVYGHTWPFCRSFIYLFHMAVFFMASGYCYTANITDFKCWNRYIWKKVKGLYLPFLICNGSFVLLSNLFLELGFYTDNPDLLSFAQKWPVTQSLFIYTGLIGIVKQLIKAIAFIGSTQLGTATWFLTSLFFVLTVHSGLSYLIKLYNEKKTVKIELIVFLVVLILSEIVNVINPSIIFVIKCFPCTYVAFLLGRFVKKLGKEAYTSWMCVLAFVTLVVLSFFFNIEVSDGKIGNVTYFVVASVCGWIMMKGLAGFLLRIGIGIELLKYIGQHTMSILCLHVLCFKIISYIYIYIWKT